MSAEAMVFTPEVEAILREVAADPRSSLLKVSRPTHLRGLFERYPSVGPQTAGLTATEKHLLQVHRNEVARLLGDVCRSRLIATDGLRISTSLTVDKDVPIYTEDELRRRAEELREAEAVKELRVEQLLERCVSGDARHRPSVAELAAAMARVEPSNAARVLAGLDLTARGKPRAALDLYQVVLARYPGSEMESLTWDNAAHAWDLLGREEVAFQASTRASEDNDSVVPRFVSVFLALHLELANQAQDLAKEINELVAPNHRTVEWYVSSVRSGLAGRAWHPTRQSQRLALMIRDSAGGAAGRIADVWN